MVEGSSAAAMTLVATLRRARASLAVVDSGTPPSTFKKKKAAPMAAQKVVGASPVAVEAASSLERTHEKEKDPVATLKVDDKAAPKRDVKRMAASLAALKAVGVSPAGADAGLTTWKIYERGESPVTAQKAVRASPVAEKACFPLRRSMI